MILGQDEREKSFEMIDWGLYSFPATLTVSLRIPSGLAFNEMGDLPYRTKERTGR